MNIRHGIRQTLTISALLVIILAGSFPKYFEKAFSYNFGTPTNVSNTLDGESSNPQIAAAGKSVFLVWRDDDSGSDAILFSKSTDSGDSYGEPITLSPGSSSAIAPRIATASEGDEIYVTWEDEGEIFLAASKDSGAIFDEPINISNSVNSSRNPEIAVGGSNLYIAWVEDVTGPNLGDIFVSISNDGGASFSTPTNISNSTLTSDFTQLHATDNSLYIIWKEFDGQAFRGDIFFSSLSNGGQSFSDPINLSGLLGGDSFSPQIAVAAGDIYVVWGDPINLDTFLAISSNGGQSFSDPINLSGSTEVFTANNGIVAVDAKVYVVWQQEVDGLADIFLVSIQDAGNNISAPIDISNSATSISRSPKIAASDSDPPNLYVTWQEVDSSDIYVAASKDGGGTFSDPINLSSTGNVLSASFQISAAGVALNVAWEDSGSDLKEIFARTILDSGQPSVSIESITDTSPRWGLDQVSISGNVNANSTDTISIDWGDGETELGITISGNSWGPVSHVYSSANTGTRELVAKLLDDLSLVKASDSFEIEVQRHQTSLQLNAIFSVISGADILIEGILTDLDTNDPVIDRNITFTGSGVTADFPQASTMGDGTFSSVGASPEAGDSLTVQAHFSGDVVFEGSDSNIMTYDTLTNDSLEFIIPEGSPSGPVELSGFNASISFDNVLSEGSVFVSLCDAPESPRYLAIEGLCLRISSAVELAENSSLHITMRHNGLVFPDGYSSEDVSLFHESANGIVDITESRSADGQTVTGGTTTFSKFIGGIALHDEPSVGAERLPLFVGKNELFFTFPKAREISFANNELVIGNLDSITVIDPYANIDSTNSDSINATISSTSDPNGISIVLQETGPDTGTFSGSFRLTAGASTNSTSELHASPGDDISGSYEGPGVPPLRVAIDGVVEAGIVEAANVEIPAYLKPTPTRADVYELRLVDARLGSVATVNITMFYGNFSGVVDPRSLGITTVDKFDCFEVISTNNGSDIDELNKTITGYATDIGRFALVLDDHIPADQECFSLGAPPGGGGGGLPRPGTGIILLDHASAKQTVSSDRNSSSGGGGGGGGHTRSTSVAPAISGSNVETTLNTSSGPVTVHFDTVNRGSGQLMIEANEASVFQDFFEDISLLQDDIEHGIIRLDETTYTTAGDVFNIDASRVQYTGKVEVTIPYDAESANAFGSESDIRFLHYNDELGRWEDMTTAVDETANTVTGTLYSLSPVTAAIVLNGGTGGYSSIGVPAQLKITKPDISVSQSEVLIATELSNPTTTSQDFVMIIQVLDSKGIVQQIKWEKGSLPGSGTSMVNMDLAPMESGNYTMQVFVLTDMENPWLLSYSKTVLAIQSPSTNPTN